MKKSRIVKSGFRGMGRHKVRTFFMMLGIVVGIFALMVIFSIGQGTENQVMSEIEKLFSANDILISAGGTGMGGPRQGRVTTFTIADLEAIAEEIPNVEIWDPLIMTAGREVVYKDRSATTNIFAHSPEAEIVWNRTTVSGQFFDDQDMESSARVALIGQDLLEELFGDADPLGEQVFIHIAKSGDLYVVQLRIFPDMAAESVPANTDNSDTHTVVGTGPGLSCPP